MTASLYARTVIS